MDVCCRLISAISRCCCDVCYTQCREFVRDGADHGSTPSEVVQACDITFSCVSDPMALKDVWMIWLIFLPGSKPAGRRSMMQWMSAVHTGPCVCGLAIEAGACGRQSSKQSSMLFCVHVVWFSIYKHMKFYHNTARTFWVTVHSYRHMCINKKCRPKTLFHLLNNF